MEYSSNFLFYCMLNLLYFENHILKSEPIGNRLYINICTSVSVCIENLILGLDCDIYE